MLKSLRIWAPSPTSRHCRERATSEPVEPGCGMACVGTPAAPSRKKTMQPRQHVLAVADAAVDKSHMLDGVERCHVGITRERADLALYREFADPLDQLVARLSVGDEIGDRDLLEFVELGKGGHTRAAHHGAVVVHQLGKDADRGQPR